MKPYIHTTLLLMLACWLGSCTTPKNVAYFQDAEAIRGMTLQNEQPFRSRPKDKINIVVSSTDPMLVNQFNLTSVSQNLHALGTTLAPETSIGGNTGGSAILAYTVDEQGDIDFPVLGKVSVQGKTRQEVAAHIRSRLIARELVLDPIVTVEYVNLMINVLGEVNRPGRINAQKDYFTILDALAEAGDLTINGQRENVMVFREVAGEDQTYVINLCDRQNMLSSPAYYLQQNDVVYVTPNSKKQREAKTAGNTFNQPAIWVSLVSLISTMAALWLK